MSLYSTFTNQQLVTKFDSLIDVQASSIKQAAEIWVEMRERKLDLSKYPSSFHRILPLVANGKLLPKAIMELAGENSKLLYMSELPVQDQKSILKGKEFEIVRNGEIELRPYTAMSFGEAKLLTNGGHINTIAEQKVQIKKAKAVKRSLPLKPKDVEKIREITWRQSFKQMWNRAKPEDKIWARKFIKES